MPRLVRAGIRAAAYGGGAGGAGRLGGGPVSTAAMPIGQVDAAQAAARPTGLDELDRVLGGGLVPGAVLLLAGEPGVGKSTLLLEAGALVAASGPVLYITGEESAAQVRLRADRIGAVHENLYLAAETDLDAIITHVETVQPRLLIIDSVQTIAAGDVDGVPGGVTQVREVAAALIAVAKQRGDVDHPGRPRDQGRLGGRSAHPGAPRRRGAAFRGRPALAAADGPRGQEPVRPDGRGGLLRSRRVRPDRAGRPERPVPLTAQRAGARHLRDRHPGGAAAAARRGAGAGRRAPCSR